MELYWVIATWEYQDVHLRMTKRFMKMQDDKNRKYVSSVGHIWLVIRGILKDSQILSRLYTQKTQYTK